MAVATKINGITAKKEIVINSGISYPIIAQTFDGEHRIGDMGAPIEFMPQYQQLAVRSWEAFTTSEVASLAINNYVLWTIGNGLKLSAEPVAKVLESEGIKVTDDDVMAFKELTGSRFELWANSEYSSYDNMSSLHEIASTVKKNATISGDCLVIQRFTQTGHSIQVVDGMHVQQPPIAYVESAKTRGNSIKHGVEINSKGRHVAYYVRNADNTYTRVQARSSRLGHKMAFLVYGNRYRIDYVRGMPLLSVILNTLKSLDRYKEAMVGQAEETAKIAYQIVHGINSTGENAFKQNMANSVANGFGYVPETAGTVDYEKLAQKVMMTTGKSVVNMPIDSEIKTLESKNTLYFKEFYETNREVACAAIGIPPEVAMGKFGSNFAASKMATGMWEYTIRVDRTKFKKQLYDPIYFLYLDTQVLQGKIQAKGYLDSLIDNNIYALMAWRNNRFLGVSLPQQDEVKAAKAARILLGNETIPLTDATQITERLNLGNFSENIRQFRKELAEAEGLNEAPEPAQSNEIKETPE